MQLLSASRPELIPLFTGLPPRRFGRLVGIVARPGRQWCPPLADRVLLVAVYYRTNLTIRQVAPLFGITDSAAFRIMEPFPT